MGTHDDYICTGCGASFPTGRSLGGHRKHCGHTAALPTPRCFTDDKEWQYNLQQLRVEHPEKQRISREYALAEACAVCPIEFMAEMQSKGHCFPPASAIPQRDLGLDELELTA